MSKFYTILRLNEDTNTATVLLEVNEYTLQQDVEVKDFKDVRTIEKSIATYLDKLEEDTKDLKAPSTISPEVEALVDQKIEIE